MHNNYVHLNDECIYQRHDYYVQLNYLFDKVGVHLSDAYLVLRF